VINSEENNVMIKILQLIMTSDNSIILPAEQFKPEEPLDCFCENGPQGQ